MISNIFGSGKQSQTQILCKKMDIVTSQHICEPQWDIVMDITDALNADGGRAKRVLAHLKRILERAMATSWDNQQLSNCLDVIDSLVRNGNDHIVSVIHSTFLSALSRLALSEDRDSAQLKSLLQSAESARCCRDRALELFLDWQGGLDIDAAKYPQFRAVFVQLKRSGAAFDKIVAERERKRRQQQRAHEVQIQSERKEAAHAQAAAVEFRDEAQMDNPWSAKNMAFGRWYKARLKSDLARLIDMICMAQDVIAMKNADDANTLCMELREANKRLLTITLRTEDPPAIDCLLQLVCVISALLDCHKKLLRGHKFVVPGVSRQFLHVLTKML